MEMRKNVRAYGFYPFLSGSGFFYFAEIFKTNAKMHHFRGLSMKRKLFCTMGVNFCRFRDLPVEG